MNDRQIFQAADQLQKDVATLANEVELALPHIEDALHGPDEHPGGEASRQGFIDLCLQRLAQITCAVNIALNKFILALGSERRLGISAAREDAPFLASGQEPDVPAAEEGPSRDSEALAASTPGLDRGEQMPAIGFQRLKNLREPSIVERAIEVQAPLRGEERPVLLRLEALRMVDQAGYEIAICRQETILVSPALRDELEPEPPPREVRIWVVEDLIHNDRPTAKTALEQVMGFLEMRCG